MNHNRRAFIKKSALTTLSAALGADIVFGKLMPNGYVPLIFEQQDFYKDFNKDKGLIILNDRPWNAEAQAHILDDRVTPASRMFVRNNGGRCPAQRLCARPAVGGYSIGRQNGPVASPAVRATWPRARALLGYPGFSKIL